MPRPQRNNITRLPWEIRKHICQLLLDGKTYDEIRNDYFIASGCQEQRKNIHNTSIGAYKNSPEYFEYCEKIKNSEFPLAMDEKLLVEAYRKFSDREKKDAVTEIIIKSKMKDTLKL